MRVTDRLESAIIKEILYCDNAEEKELRMDAFSAAVRDVLPSSSFEVFERPVKGDAQGLKTVTDWTDLTGYQKRILIKELPDLMDTSFLMPESVEPTKRLWNDLAAMFDIIERRSNGQAEVEQYNEHARSFSAGFLSHPGRGGG